MSSRPKRERKAPDFFGKFAPQDVAEVASESDEEVPPRRRPRRKTANSDEEEPAAPGTSSRAAVGAGGSDSESSEEEEEEEGDQPAAAGRGGGGKRARKVVAYEPQPPAEPRSRGDVASLLFACPALIDSLLQPDGLRTVTLVARDAANLAAAVGARTADVAGMWHQLARTCDPRLAGNATAAQAVAVVRRAIQADPARLQRMNTSRAQSEYRVGRKDLEGLNYTMRHSQSYWASSVKMFTKLDVLAIAHRKHGHMAVLEAALAEAKAKSTKSKEVRAGKVEQRKRDLGKALAKAGLEGPTCRRHGRKAKREIKAFIKKGVGSVAATVAVVKAETAEDSARRQRQQELAKRLQAEGVSQQLHCCAAQAYINGRGGSTGGTASVDQVVAGIKGEQEARVARAARHARLSELLTAEGLVELLPAAPVYVAYHDGGYYGQSRVPGLVAYIGSGEGSEDAVLAAALQIRHEDQAREQRRTAVADTLAAQGLELYNSAAHLPAMHKFVQEGVGTVGELVHLARQLEERDQARAARQARMTELLVAEGLEYYVTPYRLPGLGEYVRDGTGSDEGLVREARALQREKQARDEREAGLAGPLGAEGIVIAQYMYVPAVRQYIQTGGGTQEEALAAAREAHQAAQARVQRRQQMAQLMQAEGMAVAEWEYRVPALRSFLLQGTGSAVEAVAQARAHRAAAQGAAHGFAQNLYDSEDSDGPHFW